MNSKPYAVTENYFPKEEYFEEVLNILKESTDLIKEHDGLLMYLILKPEDDNGPISALGLWSSHEKFNNFVKGVHSEKIIKSGLAEKLKSYTTDMTANLYTVEQGWHAETHD
jgi:heme-degrading monooxygenase HmoA